MSKVCRAPFAIAVWLIVACSCGAVPNSARAAPSLSPPSSDATEADARPGLLHGSVSDPSGARIPGASIHIQNQDASLVREITTDTSGRFNVELPPGTYQLVISAGGFRPYRSSIDIKDHIVHAPIEARLAIDAKAEEVTVASAEDASTEAAENKSALIFKEDQLKDFSNDDNTFQQEIRAMAGGDTLRPPEILVDGFSNGRFPPKNTIREIRINQNSYSAQYDQFGRGRVEILTRPGTDQLHGSLSTSGIDSALDTNNPYAVGEPPYYTLNLDGNVSGAFNKKTSFFLSATLNDQQNNGIVDAIDPTLLTPLSETVPAPQIVQTYGARLDRRVTPMNTFTGRYQYNHVSFNNSGVGLLVLPSEGLDVDTTTQTLQLTDTQVIGAKLISDAHFQYLRTRNQQNPVSTGAAVVVEGVFNGGGNPAQKLSDNQDRYEFQELITVDHGKQYMRFGGRYRLLRDASFTTANFNGQFTFPSLDAYQLALAGETPAQIFTATGETTQYNLTAGLPSATLLTGDLGVFAEDEWKVRSNLNFDFGFRVESQSAVPDHFDPSPHFGFAWGVRRKGAKRSIVVLRGGSGIFYDRFAAANILTAIRQQSGAIQPSYYVENPNFFQQYLNTPPPASSLSSVAPTLYNIDPHLRTEYGIFTGVEAARSVGNYGSLSVTYLVIRANHEYLSRNINAPLPGTYNPADPGSGVRPFGGTQNIYQFSSEGVGKNQVLFANAQLKFGKNVTGFATYEFDHAIQDVGNPTTFPSNSYHLAQDYGRAAQPNQTSFVGANINLPLGFICNLYNAAMTGVPFNITTGTDLNGDSIYNDRPAFATNPTSASIPYKTRFGTFDANPQPGEKIIPINYGSSPGFDFLQASLNRTFKFGPRPGAAAPAPVATKAPAPRPDAPYSLTFGIDAGNILNHVNPGPPVGVLSSPLFGQSISLNPIFSLNGVTSSANRIVTLRANFSF
jgi:hypothetical protein